MEKRSTNNLDWRLKKSIKWCVLPDVAKPIKIDVEVDPRLFHHHQVCLYLQNGMKQIWCEALATNKTKKISYKLSYFPFCWTVFNQMEIEMEVDFVAVIGWEKE